MRIECAYSMFHLLVTIIQWSSSRIQTIYQIDELFYNFTFELTNGKVLTFPDKLRFKRNHLQRSSTLRRYTWRTHRGDPNDQR